MDAYEQIKSYSWQIMKRTMQSIKVNDLYDYFLKAINNFSNSWYGTKLMNAKKTKLVDSERSYYRRWGGEYDQVVTYKNVYNFCKSLVHYTGPDNEYIRMPLHWESLGAREKLSFTKKINKLVGSKWFNIYWNIMRPHVRAGKRIERDEVKNYVRKIHDVIVHDLLDITLEDMIVHGVLSKSLVIPKLTNLDIFDPSRKKGKADLVAEVYKNCTSRTSLLSHSYNYVNNTPYDAQPSFLILEDGKRVNHDYKRAMSMPRYAWYVAAAHGWIAQINFAHRFIHTRVTYITAATGVGKSTEIPKLYAYYLKALDYCDDSTVLVTVPRIEPAENVSRYIALQMGFPIEAFATPDAEYMTSTTNMYVQYKHSGSKHMSYGIHPKIRFVTDGSAVMDVKNAMGKRNYRNYRKTLIPTRKNIYDIIIVDEAHEHNTNMDIILSLVKNALVCNNTIRLGIVSATMDADEARYRSFYRDVNDNRKYPPCQWIRKHGIDRINIDRRLHISPPSATTKYKIDEYYLPNEDPVSVVDNILKTTTEGHILIFQPGVKDITKLIDMLADADPYKIVIPYHAKATAEEKKIATRGEKNPLIRKIIVATNIAEASITIDGLKFVIDTGVEKTTQYDYKARTTKLITRDITESSRLQRKGRVGRTSSGTVYYLYEKGRMEKVRKQFNIASEDIHMSLLFALMRDSNDLPLFSDYATKVIKGDVGPLSFTQGVQNIADTYTSDYDDEYVTSAAEVIAEMYRCGDEIYDYVGKEYKKIHQNIQIKHKYTTGYSRENLMDGDGVFYIVHPNELAFSRDIFGRPCSSLDDITTVEKNVMKSKKMESFWNLLADKRLCEATQKTRLGIFVSHTCMGTSDLASYILSEILFYCYGLTENDEEFQKCLSVIVFLSVLQRRNIFDVFSGYQGMPWDVVKQVKKKYASYIRGVSDLEAVMLVIRIIETMIQKKYAINSMDTVIEVIKNKYKAIDKTSALIRFLSRGSDVGIESQAIDQEHFDELREDLVDMCICLLYTSPSPRDGLLSRMPSSA